MITALFIGALILFLVFLLVPPADSYEIEDYFSDLNFEVDPLDEPEPPSTVEPAKPETVSTTT